MSVILLAWCTNTILYLSVIKTSLHFGESVEVNDCYLLVRSLGGKTKQNKQTKINIRGYDKN